MALQVVSFDIGIKNLAYCIVEKAADGVVDIKHLEKVDLGCRKNETQKIIDATIALMDDIMFTKLDTTLPVVVLIESQMTSIMKCIQNVINTYFKVVARYQSADITTKFVSAKHKLNLIASYSKEYTPPDDKLCGTKYQQNKKDSVDFGRWLLANKYKNEVLLTRLNASKKVDDEYDVLLMCVYYVEMA